MADNTENMRRERDSRLLPIEAAQQAQGIQDRQAQPSASVQDQEGYWNGDTFVHWFRAGISTAGGPDVAA